MLLRTPLMSLVLGLLLVLPGTAAIAGPSTGATADEGGAEELSTAQATERTFTYEVQTRGQVAEDPAAFAATAREILGDARGWTLGGSLAFQEVSWGGEFNLILASPQAVDDAHEVCSPNYSCRVGDDVLINDRNWRDATPAWREAGGDLSTYRQYLINHEVGHFLGFGHFDCPGAGEPAPVMQQQSIDLQGCEPSGWPLSWERDTLAERYGVAVHDDWVFVDVLRGHTHRDPIHTVADAGITTGYADGTFRPYESVSRAHVAAFLHRALDLPEAEEHHFDDVHPDNVHAPAINAVAEAGVVVGYDEVTYGPEDTVERGQLATMVAQAYGYEAGAGPEFDDVSEDHVHADAIAALSEAGVVSGFGDGTFRPASDVTRAQVATVLEGADPAL
jgi:hypothetical protein